jgi:hypothetical protein
MAHVRGRERARPPRIPPYPVVDLGSGAQMVLVGVQQTSLTGDWIFSV